MKVGEKMQWEGSLEIYENEGGYSSPTLFMNNEDVAEKIQDKLRCHENKGGYSSQIDVHPKGMYRITLEKVGD